MTTIRVRVLSTIQLVYSIKDSKDSLIELELSEYTSSTSSNNSSVGAIAEELSPLALCAIIFTIERRASLTELYAYTIP